MKRITVLLADDHEVVLEGLQMLLNLEDDIEVIGEARTGREAVQMTQKLHPAVVIMIVSGFLVAPKAVSRALKRSRLGHTQSSSMMTTEGRSPYFWACSELRA